MSEQTLSQLESQIIQSIQNIDQIDNSIPFFAKRTQDILKNGVLKNRTLEETNHFINQFIPELVSKILDLHVEFAIGKKINSYLEFVIPLFSKYFFDKTKNQFIQATSQIFTNSQCPLYLSTTPYQNSKKNPISPLFDSNISTFSKTPIIQNAATELKQFTFHDYSHYFFLLKIIYSNFHYFDQKALNLFIHASCSYYTRISQQLEVSKNVHDSFEYLHQIAPDSNSDQKNLEKLHFDLAVRSIKLNSLTKRYYGLSFIKNELNFGKLDRDVLCFQLQKENIISNLLSNMHDELVIDFSSVFRIMAIRGCASHNNLLTFWNIAIHKNPLTIEPYFTAWRLIYTGLPKELKDKLWEIICQSDVFPIASLQFIQNIATSGVDEENLMNLFRVLKEYYNNCEENEVRLVIADTLASLIPDDPQIMENTQKECFQLLKNHQQIDLALSLFKASFRQVDAHKAKEAFDLLMKAINKTDINNLLFLEVIEKVARKMEGQLTDEEFNDLSRLLTSLLQVNSDAVYRFVQNLMRKPSVITDEQLFNFFKEIVKLALDDLQYENLIIHIFHHLNKSNFCVDKITMKSIPKDATKFIGIDDLWELCFKISENKIVLFICYLYAHSRKTSTKSYIKLCMENADKNNALFAIFQLIRFIESNFEKSLLGIHENRYIPRSDYYTVKLIGDVNLSIRVPKDISFFAFRDRVSAATGIDRERLTFYEGANMIQSPNFNLFNSLQLEVRKWNSTIKKLADVDVKSLPSSILGNSKYQKKLFELLISDNDQIASSAFNILNELPTNNNEKELLTKPSNNWDDVFDFQHKNLLFYRIHAIGHFIENEEKIGNTLWISYFYGTGGATSLFNKTFHQEFNAKDDSKQFLILLDVCNLIISKIDEKDKIKLVLNQNTLTNIINQALSISKSSRYANVLWLLLSILEKFSAVDSSFVLNCELFYDLFNETIFSSNKSIRGLISMIAKRVFSKDAKKDLIDILDRSVHSKCKEYFSLLLPIIKKSNSDSKNLFDKIIGIIYREYNVSDNQNTLITLSFIPPNKHFTWGIFTAANLLVNQIEHVDNIGQLFKFILDHVLYNKYLYINFNSDFFQFLSALIKLEPLLIKDLMPKLQQISTTKLVSFNDSSLHVSHRNKPKGLTNLGATCYMNSSIQQLFNIPEFRNQILASKSGDENEWLFNFQYLLAELLYYPTTSINPIKFVEKWKWYDNEKLNFNEQMDAGEFIGLLLSRLSDIIPGADECFQGIIHHEVVGNEVDYHSESTEKFTIFPLEVKDYNDVSESFQAFLTPDEFIGDNRYNAEGIGKIDAKRFHRILKTPDVLILQLKRFTYSLANGEREKLNSRYEFPLELDLDPIMSETILKSQKQLKITESGIQSAASIPGLNIGLDQSADVSSSEYQPEEDHNKSKNMFDLIGVQMHIGDCISGHYYSICDSGNNWFKYDDTIVSEFDPHRLKYMAFGGIQPASYNDPRGLRIENNESAYILYYRKRKEKSSLAKSLTDDSLQSIIEGCPEINEMVTQKIQDEISKLISYEIVSNPDYTNFLLNLANLITNDRFRFEYLIELTKHTLSDSVIQQIFELVESIISNSAEISEAFLSREDLLITYLVQSKSSEIRHYYASKMIIQAIDKCNKPEIYLHFLENTLNTIHAKDHRNELGIPLIYIIKHFGEAVDKENWIKLLFNYANKLKDDESYLSSLNLSTFFKAIRILLTNPELKKEIKDQYKSIVTDITFLHNLYQSKPNAKALDELLLIFFKEDDELTQKFFEFMKSNWNDLQPQVSARYFTLLVLRGNEYAQSLLEWVFKSLDKAQPSYIEKFLAELSNRTHPEMASVFIIFWKLWINPFLFSVSENVRHNVISLFSIIFSENETNETHLIDDTPQKHQKKHKKKEGKSMIISTDSSCCSLTKILIKSTSTLVDIVNDRNNKKSSLYANGINTSRMYPQSSFFELLKMMIQRSNESLQVVLQSSKEIVDTFKKLSQIESVAVDSMKIILFFLKEAIKDDKSAKQFFSHQKLYLTLINSMSFISFESATRQTSIDDTQCLMAITPSEYATCFFKSKLFEKAISNCFNATTPIAPKLSRFIISNLNEEDSQKVSLLLWSDVVFKRNCINCPQYFYLSSEILRLFPLTSLIFIQSKAGKDPLGFVSKSMVIKENEFNLSLAMQVLTFAQFVEAFQKVNDKQKVKFVDCFNDLMKRSFSTIQKIIDRIFDPKISKDAFESVMKLMAYIFSLNSEYENLVLQILSKGFLTKISFEDLAYAKFLFEYVIFILMHNKDRQKDVITLLHTELQALKETLDNKENVPAVLDILSAQILLILSKQSDPNQENDILTSFNSNYQDIFISFNNIQFFSSSTCRLLWKLDKVAGDWKLKCASLIPKEIKKITKASKKGDGFLNSKSVNLLNLRNSIEFVCLDSKDQIVKNPIQNVSKEEMIEFINICKEINDPITQDLINILSKVVEQG